MSVVAAPTLEIRRSKLPVPRAAVLSDFWALTKPEVNLLIVTATFTGFYLGCPNLHPLPLGRLVAVLLSTLLLASGAGALNQFLEHAYDAQMRRTLRRPLAAGRLRPVFAVWFGIALAAIGAASLNVFVNALTSGLALSTLGAYLFIYTPLKRKSPLCTLVGALPGAIPPLIGWAAARGSIASPDAWTLYAMLFFWQFPHFMAIAWLYREDYARAGYVTLPTRNASRFLNWFTVVPSVGLVLTSFTAAAESGRPVVLFSAAAVLGLGLLHYVRQQVVLGSRLAARRLLKATIFYLLLEMLALVLAKN